MISTENWPNSLPLNQCEAKSKYIMELLEFLLGIAAGIAIITVTWVIFMVMAVRRLDSKAQPDASATAVEESEQILLLVETADDQFLCYNAQSMAFVCQGRDLKEIQHRFRQRFPDKSAALVAGDATAVATLKQQLKEFRETSTSI